MDEGFKIAEGSDQPVWETIHTERLAEVLGESRKHARALIAEIKASPLNPHGDNEAVIVDELIRTIGILKAETWDKVMRASIRGKVPNI